MNCAWEAYLRILPQWMREPVDKLGRDRLQEIRIRLDQGPELVMSGCANYLNRHVTASDINYCLNAASQYSPWASATIQSGYITAAGGHRVGICGNVVTVGGKVSTISRVSSLCIRVARDFPGIGHSAASLSGSILILGSPGSGKTTLLRDLIRTKSNSGETVCVVDERCEVFPFVENHFSFSEGKNTDVLSGCSKQYGLDVLIKTMNPDWVAADEITTESDCNALLHAGWCGVSLIATAHAAQLKDYLSRPVYKPLVNADLFENIIVMQKDKTWTLERINR